MKIAIMTWFHYDNYGSVLQATALTRQLESYGHHVKIIQYYPSGQCRTMPTGSFIREIYSKAIAKLAKRSIVESNNGKYFDDYRKAHIGLTNECEALSDLEALNEKYDAFVCGSDQIWSPLCFNPHYYLDFVSDAKQMIAYAPSIGTTEIADKFIEQQIALLAKRFDHISIREESGSRTIGDLIGKKIPTVLDPTFLLNTEAWNDCLSISKESKSRYLLAYFLGRNKKHWKATYELARKLKLPVKIVPVLSADLKRKGVISSGVSPKEFVELIANADYVCTDSFHGVAFSINYERKFCCFERFAENDHANQNSRIYNILFKLNLEDRLYNPERPDLLLMDISYSVVQKNLAALCKHSETFLVDALSAVDKHNQFVCREKRNTEKKNTLCCGCGACASICPTGAVTMEQTKQGFYEASISSDLCISCGKCMKVCPFTNESKRVKIGEGNLFSYKDIDKDVLSHSSSGGMAYRLARLLQIKGYSISGCIFDRDTQKAKHVLIEPSDKEGLCKLQGSKYMQSEFSPAMEKLVKCKTPIAIFGTPCQVAGARNLLRDRTDALYIDLICHGVPSYNLYQKYKKSLAAQHSMDTSKMQIIFRYKPKGWRERYIYSTDFTQEVVTHQSKDEFFLMFEHGNCYSPACYECRWRGSCSADLRIGDYWGKRFAKDTTGVSMVLAMTEHGKHIIKGLKNSAYGTSIREQKIEDYYSSQQIANEPKPVYYNEISRLLQEDKESLTDIVKKFVLPFEKRRRVMKRMRNIYEKIKQWE